MSAREIRHEHHLRDRVKRDLGGWCVKLFSVWDTGLPDRLLFLPGARIELVETKRDDAALRPTQKRVRRKLHELGFKVHVLRTRRAVDLFIEWVQAGGGNHGTTGSN